MGRSWFWFAAVAILAASGFTATASAADGVWTQRDFQLREITANLGPHSSASSITFEGTETQQAFDSTSIPWFDFTVDVTITCHPEGNPTGAWTSTGSYDYRNNPGTTVSSLHYAHVDAATVRWTTTFTFVDQPITGEADASSWYWCDNVGGVEGTNILDGITITGVDGITWLSSYGTSPQPGTSLFNYTLASGHTVTRFKPKDGIWPRP